MLSPKTGFASTVTSIEVGRRAGSLLKKELLKKELLNKVGAQCEWRVSVYASVFVPSWRASAG